MSVGPYWDPKRSSESKVCQLYGALLVNKQVLGLQVTVDDSPGVAKHGALQYLVRVTLEQ